MRFVVGSLVELWSAQEQLWAEARASLDAYPSREESAHVLKAHRRMLTAIEAGRGDRAPSAPPATTSPPPRPCSPTASTTSSSTCSSARARESDAPLAHRL